MPLALLVLGAGCGSTSVGDTCTVVTSAGMLPVASSDNGARCEGFAPLVVSRVEDYLQWRPVELSEWTVEVVPAGSIGGNHGGMTYFAQRLVQVEE